MTNQYPAAIHFRVSAEQRDAIMSAAAELELIVKDTPGMGGLEFIVVIPDPDTAYRLGVGAAYKFLQFL